MCRIEVAVIPGDGVGPELTAQAVEVLKAICHRYHHELVCIPVLAAGEAIRQCQTPLPEESLQICKQVRATLLGNIGDSRYNKNEFGLRPEFALLELRKQLKAIANVRPVRLYPGLEDFSPLKPRILQHGVDLLFVRDMSGGVLCSERFSTDGIHGKEAYEQEYYNEQIIEKTVKLAFDLALKRRKSVHNLDKSNVLASSKLWNQKVLEIRERYPEVENKHYYIDYAAMKLIADPSEFDVIVTSNLFGDIISDEGTQLTGTPYLYPSAELSDTMQGIYTPNQLHYPGEDETGQNTVNPIGMIAAAALMLRYSFGLEAEAACIEEAIQSVLAGHYATRDIWMQGKELVSTRRMGQLICENIIL